MAKTVKFKDRIRQIMCQRIPDRLLLLLRQNVVKKLGLLEIFIYDITDKLVAACILFGPSCKQSSLDVVRKYLKR